MSTQYDKKLIVSEKWTNPKKRSNRSCAIISTLSLQLSNQFKSLEVYLPTED